MSIAQGTTDIDWFLIMKILGFVTAIAVCLLISDYLYNRMV